jgi:Nuclease A inhibitor-like protein
MSLLIPTSSAPADQQLWHDSAQAAQVRQFRRLEKVLEARLSDIRVYRVGTVHIDVYIVGKVGRDLVGLTTVLIET